MRKTVLIKVIGNDKTRVSGTGGFPAPQKSDVGRKVIVKRPCMTWPGFLGYFGDDKEKTILAFYWAEVKEFPDDLARNAL